MSTKDLYNTRAQANVITAARLSHGVQSYRRFYIAALLKRIEIRPAMTALHAYTLQPLLYYVALRAFFDMLQHKIRRLFDFPVARLSADCALSKFNLRLLE